MNTSAVSTRSPGATVALAAAVCLCVLAYWAGLFGGFLFDDFQHIVNNAALRAIGTANQNWLQLALSSDAGVLRRPFSMLSFGLNAAFFGINPFAFKALNLVIHLINGVLVYALGRRLAGRLVTADSPVRPQYLGALAAALWLLHPLNVSGVLYVVQRENELSALFILAGLLCYVDGRLRMLCGEAALVPAMVGLCLFGLLATLSKENGALITAYAWVVEYVALRFDAANAGQRRALKTFFWAVFALPLAAGCLWLITRPGWLDYGAREFTLYQRLLTESRVVCDYLLWTFVPLPAWLGFYHDDIAVSTGLFHPATTLGAIAFLAALAGSAWMLRRRQPAIAFGIAWFLMGHSMESTILPLELVFEHRNYLPMAGLLLGAVCAAAPWLAAHLPGRWRAIAGAALVLLGAALTERRAAAWSDPLTLATSEARHHPDSARAQYDVGRGILVSAATHEGNEPQSANAAALPYFERSAALNKDLIPPATMALLLKAQAGPVDPAAIQDLAGRLRRARNFPDASAFLDMLISASQEKLSLTSADFATLVGAALANTHFPPKVRAMVMLNYGSYLHNAGDTQGAIHWMLAADAEQPGNAYFQLNLAVVAFQAGDRDRAREYLAAARRYDQAGVYAQAIANLQRQLMQ